jgi:D-serine deaminase-like pyridoxal phosphate-dependent protein
MSRDVNKRPSGTSGPIVPRDFEAADLINHMANARGRARRIMQEFNIAPGHICAMARSAEQRISDTALRAEFLRVLIDVNEFGREMKRRGLVTQEPAEEAAGDDAEPDAEVATALFAPDKGASDAVSDKASRVFFASLDPEVSKESSTGGAS